MNKRQKKKLKKRESFFHYNEYKKRLSIFNRMIECLNKHDLPFSLKSFWIDKFRTTVFTHMPKKIYTRTHIIYSRDRLLQTLGDFYLNGLDMTIESTRQSLIDQLNGNLGPEKSMSIEVKMAPKFVNGKLESVSLVPPSLADFDQPSIEVPMAPNHIPGNLGGAYPSSSRIYFNEHLIQSEDRKRRFASNACEASAYD